MAFVVAPSALGRARVRAGGARCARHPALVCAAQDDPSRPHQDVPPPPPSVKVSSEEASGRRKKLTRNKPGGAFAPVLRGFLETLFAFLEYSC
jgi:hypothetical protein